jgi:predicted O-methyltransferase YrrM
MNAGLVFFRVTRYLKYIFISFNRKGHGIHSPFAYDIVNRLFRKNPDPSVLLGIEKVRKRLEGDKSIIPVNDLGYGPARQQNRHRRVSEIVRRSAVPKKYGILLANMAAEFGRPLVVEFGTSFGISTMYISASCGETLVFSLEGCPAAAAIADRNFKGAGLKNIRLKVGPFDETMPDIISMGIKPGLVFIDGNHRKKPVIEYFEKMAEISDNNTVIIIDDINYSHEMEEAWKEIKQYGKVTVTMDVFRMGIVFFRKGLGRMNYVIRY